jgi:hypothetical protein
VTHEELWDELENFLAQRLAPAENGKGWWAESMQAIDKYARSAVAAEREANCKAICPFCAHGKPLIHEPGLGWLHHYPDIPDSDSSCYAAAIRALAAGETPSSPSGSAKS